MTPASEARRWKMRARGSDAVGHVCLTCLYRSKFGKILDPRLDHILVTEVGAATPGRRRGRGGERRAAGGGGAGAAGVRAAGGAAAGSVPGGGLCAAGGGRSGEGFRRLPRQLQQL